MISRKQDYTKGGNTCITYVDLGISVLFGVTLPREAREREKDIKSERSASCGEAEPNAR